MSRRPLDLAGHRSGRLVAVSRVANSGRNEALWRCDCDCGGERIVKASHIKSGFVASCGCMRDGRTKTITYSSWSSMKNRCANPRNGAWRNYGGRGVRVCDRWLESFENFLADMGERPSIDYSIDRIDNNGNYEPGNCRWATATTQGRNARSVKLTPETVEQIRVLCAQGQSRSSVSKKFGVSRSSVDNIINGSTWK